MNSWKLLQKLNYKQLLSLGVIFIKRPLYVYPVLKATSKSMLIAQQEFPNVHGKSNPANAFRHALWCMLLVLELMKWKVSLEKATQFALIITTWHEDFSPNKPVETAMDLHNNTIGIDMVNDLLKCDNKTTTTAVIQCALLKLKTSVKIFKVTDVALYADELVYLED